MDVDVRRAARVAVAAGLVALAALVVVFFVAGIQKNERITRLQQHGVPVEITVTGCLGLLGGSGSNAAGYVCRGTFSVDGRRYAHVIPGDSLLAPGTTLKGVAVPGDPSLFSTQSIVRSEHPSWRVFILPNVLLVVLLFAVVALVLEGRRRRNRRDTRPDGSTQPARSSFSGLGGGGDRLGREVGGV